MAAAASNKAATATTTAAVVKVALESKASSDAASQQPAAAGSRLYTADSAGRLICSREARKGWRDALQSFFELFLPQGYPSTVSKDYLDYQRWDTAQAFCSYLTGTLAAHSMFKGYGVGDSTASAAGATVTWLCRDLTSHVSRILFTWFEGSDLDNNAKQWRLVADVVNDMAIFLQLFSPLFPDHFLLIACLSSLMHAVVGVAGGATRSAIVQHQARANNMGDVSAKDGSQETLVNMCGLLVGLLLTPILGNHMLVFALFTAAACMHVYSNYRAVRSLQFEQLNARRAQIVVSEYVRKRTVVSPKDANAREPLFPGFAKCPIVFGAPLSASFTSVEELQKVTAHANPGLYILHHSRKAVRVHFLRDASTNDELMACIQAEIIRTFLLHGPQVFHGSLGLSKEDESELQKRSAIIALTLFAEFAKDATAAGWRLEHVQFGTGEWRVDLIE
eukprot:m.88050 g.88050  ORF g.88050 m.88050 type:complete len:449 (+) comp15160_c0_seq1:58-1404(+)